jgi:pyruvate formate lyase activating enzyme
MHPRFLDRAIDLAIQTGGCIKFDIKTWDASLHEALTGAPNYRTLENFARAAERLPERTGSPLLVASTLLVPGYVDEVEISSIAAFIAGLDRSIPFALLGFHPNFYVPDLPCTSVAHAERAEEAARAAGLSNVRVGNRQLLSGGG